MPIYEYRCQSCDSISEKLVRGGNEPTTCPDCGQEGLKRLISRAGIIFKGSGFYVTDSKSSGSSGANGSSSKPSEGKSESKSESKTESSPPSGSDSKTDSKSTASTKSE